MMMKYQLRKTRTLRIDNEIKCVFQNQLTSFVSNDHAIFTLKNISLNVCCLMICAINTPLKKSIQVHK